MAKKKHHHKKAVHHRRRRRRSGMGAIDMGGILTQVAGVAAGAAVAGIITKQFLSSQSATIQMITPVALGIATPMFLKGDLGKAAGAGMVAVGALAALKKAGIAGMSDGVEVTMAGFEELPVIGEYNPQGKAMAGDESVMAGYSEVPVISGYED
jgi:hypothetical protein